MRAAVLALCVLCTLAGLAAGQQAEVSGRVADGGGRALAGAEVLVQSEATGARRRTFADGAGSYSVTGLAPGRYKVTARMPGFRTVSRVGAMLDSAGGLHLDFVMELLGLHEVITVTSGRDAMNPSSASSLLVTRGSAGATLPANGGDYRVLFDLMPGVITTPAGTNDAGQFTSNGQRPNSNSFRVDGVSANTGVGSNILPGAFPGASLPAMTAMGSTENLVSNETAQSVELRTSDFSPEFSDRPGAEAIVHTRSGSNDYHGEAFGRVRDSAWNARDWFAKSRNLQDFPRPFYSRLGAVFGGRIVRDRTYFLVSGEAATLWTTGVQLASVPSLAAREDAPTKLKQILRYYPAPIGPDLGGGEAEGMVSLNQHARLLATSFRIDQALGSKGNLFARVVESPSTTGNIDAEFNWVSGTLGATIGAGGGIHDLRVAYSRAQLTRSSFGGGPSLNNYAVFALAGMLPGYALAADGTLIYQPTASDLTSVLPPLNARMTTIGLSVPGLGQFLSYGAGEAQQDQLELRETFSRTVGRHELRLGAGYVRQQPRRSMGTYAVLGVAASLESLLAGKPLAVTSSNQPQYGDKVHKGSLFAQDTFRLNNNVSLLWGISWDITPPVATGTRVPAISGLWTGTEWQHLHGIDLNGTAPWPMRYTQFAPRIGVAYRLPTAGLLLRAAAGTFRDTALGSAVNPINGAPFNSWLLGGAGTGMTGSSGSSGGSAGWPGADSVDVQRFLAGSYPSLRLPTVYQWRLSLEKGFESRGFGSIAYSGSAGRSLLGHQAYLDPDTGVLERTVTMTRNSASYHSLQARYSGSLAPNLYTSMSYSWAHSIDDGSQDSSVFLIHPGYRLSEARGASSFDVRHAFTGTMSYRVPKTVRAARLPSWLAGWTLSGVLRARTGFPIDVLNTGQSLGQSFDNVGRPDRVPGAPVWMDDPRSPGGRRLNRAAFRVPDSGMQGTLGRNSITGNGLAQLDMSLRRDFQLPFGVSAQLGVNVFNVPNHSAFADPVAILASPWFGQSTSMQNLMFGQGTANTGLPPLFQSGGARSAEFTFRLSF